MPPESSEILSRLEQHPEVRALAKATDCAPREVLFWSPRRLAVNRAVLRASLHTSPSTA